MNYIRQKIVVTGGAGFVGSQLAFHLSKKGHEVVVIDDLSGGYLENLMVDGALIGNFIEKDIRSNDLVRHLTGADAVVHLAGISSLPRCQSEPQYAWDVNTSGLINVLEASRQIGVRRFIFSSTSAVYENSEGMPYGEDDVVEPDLVYAMTKLSSEKICRAYANNYGMDIIIARFFNLYGPHQDSKRLSPPFTSYVARELALGRTPVLFNNSDAKRDYVHSQDVIRLLDKMLASTRAYRADVFNVASGIGYSVPELYNLFQQVSGISIEAVYRSAAEIWNSYSELHEGKHSLSRKRIEKEVFKSAVGNIEKTQTEFSWKAETSIEEGLRSVWDFTSKMLIA